MSPSSAGLPPYDRLEEMRKWVRAMRAAQKAAWEPVRTLHKIIDESFAPLRETQKMVQEMRRATTGILGPMHAVQEAIAKTLVRPLQAQQELSRALTKQLVSPIFAERDSFRPLIEHVTDATGIRQRLANELASSLAEARKHVGKDIEFETVEPGAIKIQDETITLADITSIVRNSLSEVAAGNTDGIRQVVREEVAKGNRSALICNLIVTLILNILFWLLPPISCDPRAQGPVSRETIRQFEKGIRRQLPNGKIPAGIRITEKTTRLFRGPNRRSGMISVLRPGDCAIVMKKRNRRWALVELLTGSGEEIRGWVMLRSLRRVR